MKTAMQELIEWMEQLKKKPFSEFQQSKIKELLELEKEQIIVAHNFGYLIGEDNISIKDANRASEQYFESTYNRLPNQSKTLLEILDLDNEKNVINEILEKKDKSY